MGSKQPRLVLQLLPSTNLKRHANAPVQINQIPHKSSIPLLVQFINQPIFVIGRPPSAGTSPPIIGSDTYIATTALVEETVERWHSREAGGEEDDKHVLDGKRCLVSDLVLRVQIIGLPWDPGGFVHDEEERK